MKAVDDDDDDDDGDNDELTMFKNFSLVIMMMSDDMYDIDIFMIICRVFCSIMTIYI